MEFAQLATPAALGVDRVVIRHGHGYGEEIGKAGKEARQSALQVIIVLRRERRQRAAERAS
jgi:hypothetical protein